MESEKIESLITTALSQSGTFSIESKENIGEGIIRERINICGVEFTRLSHMGNYHPPVWQDQKRQVSECYALDQTHADKLEAIYQERIIGSVTIIHKARK